VIGGFAFQSKNQCVFVKYEITYEFCVEIVNLPPPSTFVLNCIWKTNFEWKVWSLGDDLVVTPEYYI